MLKALNVNKLTRCGVTFKFWWVLLPRSIRSRHAVSCAACTLSQRGSVAARPSHQPWACRVADYFAQLNNKMGGDLKKIQVVGEYMMEIWKAVGMDMERVQFVSASEEINS